MQLKTNRAGFGDVMRTVEKGVWGRRPNRSGGQNPLGVLQVK